MSETPMKYLEYDALGPMQRDMLGELRRNYDTETAEAGLLALREEIAHELAEKIRQASAPSDADQRFVAYVNGWCDGRDEAADEIDPESDRE